MSALHDAIHFIMKIEAAVLKQKQPMPPSNNENTGLNKALTSPPWMTVQCRVGISTMPHFIAVFDANIISIHYTRLPE